MSAARVPVRAAMHMTVASQIGVDEGEANTKAQDLLKAIDARKLKPTKEQRAMVTADVGLDKLNLWFDRALTAATAADIFKDDED
jgi:hypothetical protein